MQALERALRGVTQTIPVPWSGLSKLIQPGPGHLMVVLGAPGVGKSAFSLSWALKLRMPSLIFSLDSDLSTQAARTVSALTGVRFGEIRENVTEWVNFLGASKRQLPMVTDYPLTVNEVDSFVLGTEEYFGEYPKLIVVDNLKDVVQGEGYEGHREALRELHRVARKYHTTVLILHHLNRQSAGGNGDRAPTMRDGQYAGEQDAEFVLGLYRPQGDERLLSVRVLKNRFGPRDRETVLNMDLERMSLE